MIFFNRLLLKQTLLKEKNRNFLKALGYPNKLVLDEYLSFLKRRFEKSCPHEVGIFLGIPLEDVVGFIQNGAKGCLLNSYWKVYQNPEKAKLNFASYDRARIDVFYSLLDGKRSFAPIQA
ncbi:DUF3793 family protein [Desulfosporosinus nitroreducens]|uniref:DUF3793 family protein n=1 Tax=Desulfosporosinus nitroreducens TaxID=2018668 RepID=A0ABT8QXJ2_9FIRM|nr:DUF3793 family protein [Desulfosporosinus nitroreducens]MDO0826073.1 DUF3793 family protein [Desulfosporosinus nitroreducens]